MNEHIILGGGCFWGLEKLLSDFKGVTETSVGYTGGNKKDPKYKEITAGETGHVESVKVLFDPTKVSLSELINFFFKIHDPTTLNRQGNDVGTQYRSVIFYNSQGQRSVVEEVIEKVNKSKSFDNKIVTTVEEEDKYYLAEDYHQKYLDKNPSGYTCHFIRD